MNGNTRAHGLRSAAAAHRITNRELNKAAPFLVSSIGKQYNKSWPVDKRIAFA